jgi:geranyl-CoA carboxylase alpha subunit
MPALARAFGTILIANRGEIAVRIARTARAMGYGTVAVYSDIDADMPHVTAADRAVNIGASAPSESYLNIAKLIDAAGRAGADGVHPGYGFLSENAEFAEACAAAGLVFIGPPPAAIRAMADKARAKHLMLGAKVPCVPGYEGEDQSPARLAREAEQIGYPVMIKATAGGGGKGMRLVAAPAEFGEALQAATSEAAKAFGRGDVLLEKAIVAPRHVEVQIFADSFGHVIHLGDRDCSIQRRHQKVIEEAPAPNLTPALRSRMGAAAVAAARAVGYVNAGTVEFLVDESGSFYFLEMNTRLQVEHPVTEAVTGLDLVAWQLLVASGEALPLAQDQVCIRGHAMEARLYAEDPAAGFLPQSGQVLAWEPPAGEGVRVDHGLRVGLTISTFYDPMIAKLIGSGRDRAEARRRLIQALERVTIAGLPTNRGFLLSCLAQPAFAEARLSTNFIAEHVTIAPQVTPPTTTIALAAALIYARDADRQPMGLRGWRSPPWGAETLALECGNWVGKVGVEMRAGDSYDVRVNDAAVTVHLPADRAQRCHVEIAGLMEEILAVWAGSELYLSHREMDLVFRESLARSRDHASSGHVMVRAPMPGLVMAVHVGPDAQVEKGETLLVLSAMKMELRVMAPVSGCVLAIRAAAGEQVPNRHVLVEMQSG